MLYEEPYTPGYKRAEPAELGAGYDAFSMLGSDLPDLPWAPGLLIPLIMRLGVGKGTSPDDPPVYASWGETTETHKPMADLFTGAIFCDRADVLRTFDALREAFTGAGGATAVTLRFMRGGSGLLRRRAGSTPRGSTATARPGSAPKPPSTPYSRRSTTRESHSHATGANITLSTRPWSPATMARTSPAGRRSSTGCCQARPTCACSLRRCSTGWASPPDSLTKTRAAAKRTRSSDSMT